MYITDTDSLYIETNYWDVLDKTKLVGEELCQGKDDYKSGGIFYGLFLAPKKLCLTIEKFAILRDYKTLTGFNYSRTLVDCSQYSKMIEGKKTSALLPKSWKKSFKSGIVIPTKMIFCNECNDKGMCNKWNSQITEKKNLKLF